jgi:hypothetical protein
LYWNFILFFHLKEFLQRQKETEYHKEWEKQEDSVNTNWINLTKKIEIYFYYFQ